MMTSTRLAVAALVAAGALTTAPACAVSYERGYGYGVYGERPTPSVERIAYDRGFHEGTEAGEKDAKRGRSFEVQRHDDFRDADEGYHRQYGDKEFYRRYFREGFERGYADAYNRYAYYRR